MFCSRLISRVATVFNRPTVAVRAISTGLSESSIHKIPALTYDVNNGISEFLSPEALNTAWTKYQTLTLDHLTKVTVGTEYEGRDPKAVLGQTARNPETAHIFNYASMAHNNHIFFSMLANIPASMPNRLKVDLESSFGSIETLRREMIGTALSMFGPGFVWLVKTSLNEYRTLTTYLAGTPYANAHWRHQSSDMNTLGANNSAAAFMESTQARIATNKMLPPGGILIQPLLCLNTWEHVWLTDYGIEGKMQYCVNWWHKVDWEAVERLASMIRIRKDMKDPSTLRNQRGEAQQGSA